MPIASAFPTPPGSTAAAAAAAASRAPDPQAACEMLGLRKYFGATIAVDDLSLRVPRGTLYAFLGPNGAGKTTSLRMLAGVLRPDLGRAFLGGIDVHAAPER